LSEFTNRIDLEACLSSGQVFRFQQVDGVWIGVDGHNVYRFTEAPKGSATLEVQRLFRLDWDYSRTIPELIRRGPEMEALALASQGLRLLRPSCARETLFSFLCTSNNHISRITQMVARLGAYGEPLTDSMNRWPTLERMSSITESELRSLGFGYRGKSIPLVVQTLLSRGGEDWFEEASRAPYPELVEELKSLPGVGPKLADCIALYAFDKTEAVPIDTHLWQAATRMYFPEWSGLELSDTRRRYLGDFMRGRFGELAGLAQQLMFYVNLRSLWREK